MFNFASLDGNVFLTGKLLSNKDNKLEEEENNQFELNDIKIVS